MDTVDKPPFEENSSQPTSGKALSSLPIMPGAYNISKGNKGLSYYYIDAEAADVRSYYDRHLPALGWQQIQSELDPQGDLAILQFYRGAQAASVVASTMFERLTAVMLAIE